MPRVYYDKEIVLVIKCSINDDMFITSSTGDLNRAFIRIKQKCCKHNNFVHQTIVKNGINNYYVEVLEKLDGCENKFDIMAVEAKYIKALSPI
jgi:hypothetical protein